MLLLGGHDFRPAILLVGLRRGVCGPMLLQASLHAVYRAPPDLQTAVDGGGVYACFQELDDLLLDMVALFATAGHVCDGRFGPTSFVWLAWLVVPGVS